MDEIDRKRELMTKKLSERENERLTGIDKRESAKEASKANDEQINNFENVLGKEESDIKLALSSAPDLNRQQIIDLLDELTVRSQKLQKFVADSKIFLPSFYMRKAQNTISSLQTSIQETQETLVPVKKFSFRKKKEIKPKAEIKPKKDLIPDKIAKNVNFHSEEPTFHGLNNQSLQMNSEDSASKDINIDKLQSCHVTIQGSPSTMHITGLQDCTVLVGPVQTSIFIEDCISCKFILACQQLRIHTTFDSNFYIHVTSRAIIEHSKNLGFAAYNWSYPNIEKDFAKSELSLDTNNWSSVADFNWLSTSDPSPNWFIINESDVESDWIK